MPRSPGRSRSRSRDRSARRHRAGDSRPRRRDDSPNGSRRERSTSTARRHEYDKYHRVRQSPPRSPRNGRHRDNRSAKMIPAEANRREQSSPRVLDQHSKHSGHGGSRDLYTASGPVRRGLPAAFKTKLAPPAADAKSWKPMIARASETPIGINDSSDGEVSESAGSDTGRQAGHTPPAHSKRKDRWHSMDSSSSDADSDGARYRKSMSKRKAKKQRTPVVPAAPVVEPTPPLSVGPLTPALAGSAASVLTVDEGHTATDIVVHDPLIYGCRSADCYDTVRKISEGTYGVVFEAKDKATNETVAMKMVKKGPLEQTEGFSINALRELNVLLSLRHPNIIPVREMVVGKSVEEVYMVMDHMEFDLRSFLKGKTKVGQSGRKEPLSQAEVKHLIRQLLAAVHHMHENWYIHRDIKSSNILLNSKGQLVLCDFGLARRYTRKVTTPYTKEVVTLFYRAPELLLGETIYSTAVDMWSVGCLFGELLTRDYILQGNGEADQINKIFSLLGTPSERTWPGFSDLPLCKGRRWPHRQRGKLRENLGLGAFTAQAYLTDVGLDLLSGLLCPDPAKRLTAAEALAHPYFKEQPQPNAQNMPNFDPDAHVTANAEISGVLAAHAHDLAALRSAFA